MAKTGALYTSRVGLLMPKSGRTAAMCNSGFGGVDYHDIGDNPAEPLSRMGASWSGLQVVGGRMRAWIPSRWWPGRGCRARRVRGRGGWGSTVGSPLTMSRPAIRHVECPRVAGRAILSFALAEEQPAPRRPAPSPNY